MIKGDQMKRILVGSRALQYWYPGDPYLAKRGKDLDYWEDGPTTKIPGEDSHDVSQHPGLMKFLNKCNEELSCTRDYLPTPEMLYTLKVSHAFWNISWPKTMSDIRFLQDKGIQLDEELFQALYQDWIIIHGKKRAYLKKTKEEFFSDNVKRVYDHDDLHNVTKYYDEPVYKKILKDGEEVLTDKRKFFELSEEFRLSCVKEEAYVTAAERFLIPSGFSENPLIAYRKSCQLLATSMSKGYFPKFLIVNWNVLHIPDVDYSSKVKKGIEQGVVRKI